jgi:branched-chain amino acid transport system substrate-binding protein
MQKRSYCVFGSLALIALATTSTAPRLGPVHAAGGGVATIGVSVPLLQLPALAKGIANGVAVAVAQANASHMVPGVTFKEETLDDTLNNASRPQTDAANARTLIADTTVIGEVGPLNSGAAKGSAAVYNNSGLVQISPANTAVELTAPSSRAKYEPRTAAGKGPLTYFRTVTTDAYQGPEDALFAKKVLHVKRVFVVDNTGAYGVGLAQSFATEAKKIGLTVVGTSELDLSQPKLGTDAVAKNIVAASGGKLDLVFFGGEYDNTTGGGTYLADALKANGLHVYFLGGDGIFDPAFIKGSSNGGVLTGYASNIGPNPAGYAPAKSYLAAAAKLFPGVAVSSYDIESYDAANVIIAAYAKAVKSGRIKAGQTMNISTRSTIATLVGQTKNFKGASGTFSFDANGDTTNRIVSIYKVSGSGKTATWTYVGLAPSL